MEHQRKAQLAKYDKYFKRFEHTKALDAALDVSIESTRNIQSGILMKYCGTENSVMKICVFEFSLSK